MTNKQVVDGGGGKGFGGGVITGRPPTKRNRQQQRESLRDFQFSDFDQTDVATVKMALIMFKDFKVVWTDHLK